MTCEKNKLFAKKYSDIKGSEPEIQGENGSILNGFLRPTVCRFSS